VKIKLITVLIIVAEANIYIVLTTAALLIIFIILFIIFAVYYIINTKRNRKINPNRPTFYEEIPYEPSKKEITVKTNAFNSETESELEDEVSYVKYSNQKQQIVMKKNINSNQIQQMDSIKYNQSETEVSDEEEIINSPVITRKKYGKEKTQKKQVMSPVSVFTVDESIKSAPKVNKFNQNFLKKNNETQKDKLKMAREIRRQSPEMDSEKF
jgi:hypothetical protein